MTSDPISVKLPDGSELELEAGASGADAAAAIGSGLAKAALAVKVDGELRDLSAPLSGGESIEVVTEKSPESLELVRHDAAHVLAESVLDLWPQAKISIETLDVVAGSLPRRALALVIEWAMMHRPELRENWARAERHEAAVPIAPLDEEA